MSPTLDTLTQWFVAYGYPIPFLGVLLESAGVPVPGEAATIVADFLASPVGGRYFKLGAVIMLAFAAAVAGDDAGFWLGRRVARPRIRRGRGLLFLSPRAMQTAEVYFERYGTPTVFLGRFITGLRVILAPAAGTSGMPWPRFAVANAAGAFLSATAASLLGYFFGRGSQLLHHSLSRLPWIVLGICFATAVFLNIQPGSRPASGELPRVRSGAVSNATFDTTGGASNHIQS